MTMTATAQFDADWHRHRSARRRSTWAWTLPLSALVLLTAWGSDFFTVTQISRADGTRTEAWILAAGIGRLGEFLDQMWPVLRWNSLGHDIANWFWGIGLWLRLLLETVQMAFAATLLGGACGFLLSFPAARNLAPNPVVLWIARRAAEIARTVPELVFALIFVFAFGVGPLAGMLAIALHTTGATAKLISEANENIDMRTVDGIRAAGGRWSDQIRLGVVPQVLPNIMSYSLLRFEINIRSSSIIGYVGAGGLGQEFRTAMSYQEYPDVLALFVITLATIAVIDFLSEKLRHRVIKPEPHHA